VAALFLRGAWDIYYPEVLGVRQCLSFIQPLHFFSEISAVPIVSAKDGTLVGTLSSTDFKGVQENNLPVLTNSIRNYMTTEPLTCTLKAPLRDVIELLASSGVHRLYVTEGCPKKPVGVISVTDIMKLLANRFWICKYSVYSHKLTISRYLPCCSCRRAAIVGVVIYIGGKVGSHHITGWLLLLILCGCRWLQF